MSVQLLDRTRKINRLLQKTGTQRVIFTDICEVMSEILNSNVLVLSKKGKLLAIHEIKGFIQVRELLTDNMGTFIDDKLSDRILNILSTKENINLETLGFTNEVTTNKIVGMVVPIDIAGERLGTLFLYRQTKNYHIEDIILGEYGATVVGLEIMRSINDENSEETRKTAIVKSAIGTLSFSEQEAIKHIFNELTGKEGILVASKIADKVGITRSVIVNALRKFESAGVIESRSLGMKGTYIKILNEVLLEELDKI
ncbi:MAG: GTP-sensing pleiotropic transcriptional regulator CodY [Firmicutes bacterium HGW-Firmicutes-1]|nr:MAG: GTP-sensing pleiotropic transcriptional regulator CodY [Firmicutes bacterium HGW-Firmicutes-1]